VLVVQFCMCFQFVGYGVFVDRNFAKGDFLLVYRGDLIDSSEAYEREERYENEPVGCFMYYFTHCGQTMWYSFFICNKSKNGFIECINAIL